MKDKASKTNWKLGAAMRDFIKEQKEAYECLDGLRREQEICEAIRRLKTPKK